MRWQPGSRLIANGKQILVESKPPSIRNCDIASIIEALDAQLVELDKFGFTIAAAQLDSAIQTLRLAHAEATLFPR